MRAHPHFNPFNIHGKIERPDWNAVFPSGKELGVEIGFSNGRWLLPFAKAHQDINMVGIEVRKAFVEKVKQTIAKEQLPNVHVLLANANTAIPELFDKESLSLVTIFFPDPWYKPRHMKRRVVQPAFLDILASVMKKGAVVHLASDKHELSLDMRELLNGHPAFENLCDKTGWAPENFPGFETDIELFHIKHKNPIYRLQYRKK